jgi:hypothetical protein
MLQLVDESIQDFLRAIVPALAGDEVEVAFEAPDSEWGAGVTKPTVNLFLWDVRRNLEQRDAGMELLDDQNGRRYRRPPLPRIACRYLVTAWTADVGDEHRLLGALLTALLAAPELPAEHLRGAMADLRPLPSIQVADPDGGDSTDFWSALGGRLKPGLDVVVTVSVDAALLAQAGPPSDRFELALGETNPPGDVAPAASRRLRVAGEVADHAAEGAVVRSPRGSSTVSKGRFVVPADPGDEVVVDTDPPQRQRVGPSGLLRFTRRVRR